MNSSIVLSSLPLLWKGALISLILAVISMFIGLVVGFTTALVRLYSRGLPNRIAAAYVSLIRGTPLLVQLYIVYYGLPQIGIVIGPWPSALIALSVNVGAYLSETIRSAISSVPKGQWEAGLSSGLSWWQVISMIIIPQATLVAIPPLSNTFISLLKDTSLVSIIAVVELLRAAQLIIARTYQPITLYITAAAIYWVLSEGLATIQRSLERSMSKHLQRQ